MLFVQAVLMVVIFIALEFSETQIISTCPIYLKDEPCAINCTTDNSQVITFYKLPDVANNVGQCYVGTCQVSAALVAKYQLSQPDSTTTTLLINKLSWDDKGDWRCDFGVTPGFGKVRYAEYPENVNYTALHNGSTIRSGERHEVNLGCLYSESTPYVKLKYLSGGTVESEPFPCALVSSTCTNSNLTSYVCTVKVSNGLQCGTTYTINTMVSVVPGAEKMLHVLTDINITCTTTNKTNITDERVIGIVRACCCPIELVVFILLLHYKIAIFTWFHVVNIAENPFQRAMVYVLLFVGTNIFCSDSCVAVIVLSSTLTHYTDYREDLVSGISFLLIAVSTFIYMVIYWIFVVYVWGPRNARCCTNTINNSDLDTTIESTRISINGDAGLTSPGRRLPPLPPLIRTDPETPVKKEKKRRKKNKPELIEDQHAEKNNSEIKHEEGSEK